MFIYPQALTKLKNLSVTVEDNDSFYVLYRHATAGETSMLDEEKNSIFYYKIQNFCGRLLWNVVCSTCDLTLNLLTTTIVAPPTNGSKWQMGFNSAFKGLMSSKFSRVALHFYK